MRRPAWAASAAFPRCWAAVEQFAQYGDAYVTRLFGSMMLKLMAEAQVVVVSKDQVDVLPTEQSSVGLETDTWGDMWSDLLCTMESLGPPPFPVMFLDLDGAKLDAFVIDVRAEAALVVEAGHMTYDNGRGATTSFDGHPSPKILPFLRLAGGTAVRPPSTVSHFVSGGAGLAHTGPGTTELSGLAQKRALDDEADGVERAAQVMQLLESVNVDLVPCGLDKAAARKAERKGRRIPLTVSVAAPKSRRQRQAPEDPGAANYSHRFDRAGGYVHTFAETLEGKPSQNFETYMRTRPDKLIHVGGRPCFRSWRPPTVVGPVSLPYVPKVREVEAR